MTCKRDGTHYTNNSSDTTRMCCIDVQSRDTKHQTMLVRQNRPAYLFRILAMMITSTVVSLYACYITSLLVVTAALYDRPKLMTVR